MKGLTHLPDDHEQIDPSNALERRVWVEPAYIGPACWGELERSSLNLSRSGVDVSGPENRALIAKASQAYIQ